MKLFRLLLLFLEYMLQQDKDRVFLTLFSSYEFTYVNIGYTGILIIVKSSYFTNLLNLLILLKYLH